MKTSSLTDSRRRSWKVSRKRAIVLALLVPAICIAKSSGVEGNRAARRYVAASWPEDSVFAGVVSNWIPVIPESLLENASVCTNREQTASYTSTMLDWEMSPFVEKLDLRCFESPDFTSSKQALLIELGGMQSTIPMSRGTNGLERLGDICYADLAQPSFVVFVRNNVFVSCFSSIDENTLTNLLFFLDEQILASLGSRGLLPEPDSEQKSMTIPNKCKSVFADESDPPLSDRAESLRVRLGWILPEQSTNVAATLHPTNSLAGHVESLLGLSLSMLSTNQVRDVATRIPAAADVSGTISYAVNTNVVIAVPVATGSTTSLVWTNSPAEIEGSMVLQEFETPSNAWNRVVGILNGSAMMDSQRVLHYSNCSNVADICLCWHDQPEETGISSVSSVTIVRGNLVGVASGGGGSNLLHAASAIMDFVFPLDSGSETE